jgi:hypothetical protein
MMMCDVSFGLQFAGTVYRVARIENRDLRLFRITNHCIISLQGAPDETSIPTQMRETLQE